MTKKIPVNRGVRQGCVLAPTLFSLYTNDVGPFIYNCTNDCPSTGGLKIPLLLLADDSIILSQTPMGLQNMLNKFTQYCALKGLELNVSKTKVMIFRGKRSKIVHHMFYVNEMPLEQVFSYDYLGIRITDNQDWGPQAIKSMGLITNMADRHSPGPRPRTPTAIAVGATAASRYLKPERREQECRLPRPPWIRVLVRRGQAQIHGH
mgnify:CR=1 FL=1